MRLFELTVACYIYPIIAGYDKSYCEFLKKTSPSLNMLDSEHRKSLLIWLRKWGCRQFESDYGDKASNNLKSWYKVHNNLLPSLKKSILDISNNELKNTVKAYDTLKKVRASESKTVGPTGASKILFALRSNLCPPWDIAMRNGRYNGNAESYKKFLLYVREELAQLQKDCKKFGITMSGLPRKLGQAQSSLIKLVDEYHVVFVTRKFAVPGIEMVEEWVKWAK